MDEFLDFLDQFKVRSKVSKENIRELVVEIARQKLIQKPHIMASCWKSHLQLLKQVQDFSGEDAVRLYYEKIEPTRKRLVSFIDATSTDDEAKPCFI